MVTVSGGSAGQSIDQGQFLQPLLVDEGEKLQCSHAVTRKQAWQVANFKSQCLSFQCQSHGVSSVPIFVRTGATVPVHAKVAEGIFGFISPNQFCMCPTWDIKCARILFLPFILALRRQKEYSAPEACLLKIIDQDMLFGKPQ